MNLNEKKVELLIRLAKKDALLKEHLEEILKVYKEDGVITNSELEEIFDSFVEKTKELNDPELQQDLREAVEKVKIATTENIEQVENEITTDLNLGEEVVEEKPVEEQTETVVEKPTYDDETKEKSDKLVQTCANSNVQAEVKPADKEHFGYDTFSIVVSKTSQHIIDSLKRLQVFDSYDINFEIRNGNYVMNILNNGKGDINNITSFETMLNTITEYVKTAEKNVDYLANLKEEHALVQQRFENEHPEAIELYEKQSLGEDLTQHNHNAEVNSANNNKEEINPSSNTNNDFTYDDNEEKSNKDLTESNKTLVKTMGTYPSAHGFVTIANLIMGIGLTIGLIVLFISLA